MGVGLGPRTAAIEAATPLQVAEMLAVLRQRKPLACPPSAAIGSGSAGTSANCSQPDRSKHSTNLVAEQSSHVEQPIVSCRAAGSSLNPERTVEPIYSDGCSLCDCVRDAEGSGKCPT